MAYDNHLYVFFFQMRFISLPNPTKNTILLIFLVQLQAITPHQSLASMRAFKSLPILFSVFFFHLYAKAKAMTTASITINNVCCIIIFFIV